MTAARILYSLSQAAADAYFAYWSFAKAFPGVPIQGCHERLVERAWERIEQVAERNPALVDVLFFETIAPLLDELEAK